MNQSENKSIRIADYDYPLPDERIAKYPLAERDASKLLLYRSGDISESTFRRLPDFLPAGSLMVFNNTRVIRARLHFRKPTGATIEVFCLEPHTPADYEQSFSARSGLTWTCLVGNLKRWHEGALVQTLQVEGREIRLTAERLGESGTGHEVRFCWDDDALTFGEVLHAAGALPIPPYLNRATEASDLVTYQTVYSRIKGSVAAPTAGLHFTPRVLAALDAAGVEREEVTLHVGAGTFRPVKSETIGGHEMHSEQFAVRRHTLERLLAHDAACTAVGTTSVRTLESLYFLGCMVHENPGLPPEDLRVAQWQPYERSYDLPATAALEALLRYMDAHGLGTLHAPTQIIIVPGYRFRIVRRMLTNFHQPQSTLLLLVSAFVGEDRWRDIYRYALGHDFRFLSYGDSSLLEP
ncbi:MAG: S-adenosylmethionine:tRNA ribosyltransferase-isomerase [Alloprevotella sp.]|nr:S-adenosylmethionine:tRNA ribosyltransferase-isomerase [Alloprevotella sp.]